MDRRLWQEHLIVASRLIVERAKHYSSWAGVREEVGIRATDTQAAGSVRPTKETFDNSQYGMEHFLDERSYEGGGGGKTCMTCIH